MFKTPCLLFLEIHGRNELFNHEKAGISCSRFYWPWGWLIRRAWIYTITFLFHLWLLVCLFYSGSCALLRGKWGLALFYGWVLSGNQGCYLVLILCWGSLHTITTCPYSKIMATWCILMEDWSFSCILTLTFLSCFFSLPTGKY